MSRGPDRIKLSDGTDISRMTVDQINHARARMEVEEDRHRRNMMLMRMQGDINRGETRAQIAMVIAAVLAALALSMVLV